ncbi:uncharacterized protein B0H18DRAFT_1021908 [Fomitopsis serialis]|uniref:uncharacterized protein n=1 Tax=Fomitopsis serialis TaxID=139415 RepID=UPI002007F45C|nr:uncharacterized protein B0H18DRAFT_1021908 [Neoantrodia serialis]KAH9921105.1 hypothetical protein B0H18DRAFT_1021908 [Neoantrodia serialis]
MDAGARRLLESVTHETLHAHNFARSSTQASGVLTDVLHRYLELLTTSCAKYAEHAGRLSLTLRDAVSALDELGLEVDELQEYAAGEGRDMARYAVHSQRRIEDLAEFKASLAVGLREDRDDAIPLVYARVPTPSLEEEGEDGSASEVEDDLREEDNDDEDEPFPIDMDGHISELEPFAKAREAPKSMQPLASPPLPLSPISNPSTPPRKRPRTSSWRPPSYVPDHLPPFPTTSPRRSPSSLPQDAPVVSDPVKVERPPTPPPPQIATTTSSADYLTPTPYAQSSLAATTGPWHLPSAPPYTSDSGAQSLSRAAIPPVQPALLGAYHHVLTHPPPPNVASVNPARYKVALAFVAQAELNPRWDPPTSVFGSSAPNAPRVAAIGPSFPIPISKLPPTPTDGKDEAEKDKKPNLPPAPPRPVATSERVTPLLSQQPSRIPDLARQVLPGSVYGRATRLTHPPILQRGSQRLTYGPGVNAPWNTNAPTPPAAPLMNAKGKDTGVNGVTKAGETSVKTLSDARLYATWDYEQKRFHEPLVPRRGRIGSMQSVGAPAPPVRQRSESGPLG